MTTKRNALYTGHRYPAKYRSDRRTKEQEVLSELESVLHQLQSNPDHPIRTPVLLDGMTDDVGPGPQSVILIDIPRLVGRTEAGFGAKGSTLFHQPDDVVEVDVLDHSGGL